MLTRRTVISAEAEAVYGTDANSMTQILAWDVDIDIRGERLDRSVMRDTLSPMGPAIGMKDVGLTFKTELKTGGGAAPGSVPEMDALLRGCGFATAAHSGTAPIIYNVVSDEASMESVSFYVYKDGNKHKITGARGSVAFDMVAGQYGICEWNFNGLYNAVGADTMPDISTALTEKPPIIYNAAFQIAGFSPVCSRMRIDLANNVVRRDDLNATYGVHSYRIAGRAPKMEFDADAVVESSNPFWGDWAGEIVDTYAILVGSADWGSSVQITGYFQYDANKYGDADGVSQYECVASLVSSDVNTNEDEIVITLS